MEKPQNGNAKDEKTEIQNILRTENTANRKKGENQIWQQM